jgi:hypothetical protein
MGWRDLKFEAGGDGIKRPGTTQKPFVEVDTQEDAEALAEVYRHVRMARRLKSQMMEDYLGNAFVMEFVDVATKAEELIGRMIDGDA